MPRPYGCSPCLGRAVLRLSPSLLWRSGLELAAVIPCTRCIQEASQAPFVTELAVTVSEREHTGTNGEAVRKRVLEAGTAKLAQKGDQVEVEYIGAVAGKDWTVDDVLECWLAVCVCAIICTVVRACLSLLCSRARRQQSVKA